MSVTSVVGEATVGEAIIGEEGASKVILAGSATKGVENENETPTLGLLGQITAETTGTVEEIKFWVGLAEGAVTTLRVALFEDNGSNLPGTLLEEKSYSGHTLVKETEHSCTGFSHAVTAGKKYWVGLVTQGSGNISVKYGKSGGAGIKLLRSTQTGAWPSSPTTTSTGKEEMSVWALGTAAAGEAPTVNTTAATSITKTAAKLNGEFNDHGKASGEYWWKWGTTSGSLTNTTTKTAISTSALESKTLEITGLAANTKYFFKAFAKNVEGETTSASELSFTTLPENPEAATGTASGLTKTEAALHGEANTRGAAGEFFFEYGTAAVTEKTSTPSAITTSVLTAEEKTITGLTGLTTYKYRIAVKNGATTTVGAIKEFTTTGAAPTAVTEAATSIQAEQAEFHGKVNPEGEPSKSWWNYGIATVTEHETAHQESGSGSTPVTAFLTQTGLLPNTTYKVQAVIENTASKVKVTGSTLTFTTTKLEVTKPAEQKTSVNNGVSLGISAANYTSLVVTGMPTGMTFTLGTLKFGGTPTVEGNFLIEITAKNIAETLTVSFKWEITGQVAPKTSGLVVVPSLWSFQITADEPTKFEPQGEIFNVHRANVSIPLSKARTAALEVRLDNPMAAYIADNVSEKPLMLKAYRKGVLLFFGPLQTAELVGNENQEATLAIVASGPEFIWPKRLVGKTSEGLKLAAGTARATRFKELCETSMKEGVGFEKMNIDFTTFPIICTNTEAFEAQPYQDLATIIKAMFEQAGGFDWMVKPIEVLARTFEGKTIYSIGGLEIQDNIHVERPNALLEWGAGRVNLNNFKHKIDLTTMINRGINITGAGPEATGAPTVVFEDGEATTAAEAWGGREELINLSVLNEEARKKFVEESVHVRMKARQTIEFAPTVQLEGEPGAPRVPELGVEYEVGDSVFARIAYENVSIFEAMVRVWGWSASLDENGKETQALTLSAT